MKYKILLLPMMFLVSACIDTSNPLRVVASSGNAILKDKFDDYKASLSSSVVEELGTPEKMAHYKEILSPHKNLEARRAILKEAEQGEQGYGFWGDVRRFFQVSVVDLDSGEVILMPEVKCAVWMSRTPDQSHTCQPSDPNCDPNHEYVYREQMDCRILSFETSLR